jgi:predicted cobalt transporter CbtA
MRGMLVGIFAGLLCFGFLKVAGEPSVDRAIAFETAKNKAKADDAMAKGGTMPTQDDTYELVSRNVQAGLGLFTGVMVYSAAFGGLFALAYALTFGRMGDFGPRATSALLASAGFVAVFVVPNLKYPASPPSIGDPDTIGMRTAFYFAMIAISLAAMIAAGTLRLRLNNRVGEWNAALIAGAAYIVVVGAATLALPAVNEVPEGFPAVVLWQFRTASLGAQLIMWAAIGLAFGALTERAASTSGSGLRLKRAAL